MWNGKPCGGNNEAVCGPEYYEVFDNIVPKRKLHGGGGEDQFAFGAQQYDYPASPEAFNATCQQAQWAHLPGGSPCMNATTNGLRNPAQEGQACIHGDCWSFGYNTQMMNLSASKCESQIGTSKCSRTHRHSVWPVPIAFPWSTAGWRDPDGPADGPCLHWNMEVGDFQAPSATMMENIAWQSVANGANGLVFYSLMDNLRPLCCHVSRFHHAALRLADHRQGTPEALLLPVRSYPPRAHPVGTTTLTLRYDQGVIPNTAHGCNESLPLPVAEANIKRLEGFASQFMRHEELLVGETLTGVAVGAVVDPCPINPCHNHTTSKPWPRVQHIVKRPRGVASGTNTTPTTLVFDFLRSISLHVHLGAWNDWHLPYDLPISGCTA